MLDKVEKTIFIVGNSRSGTTMLGRIFNKHRKIHTFKELHYFDAIAPASKYASKDVLTREESISALNKLFRNERDGMYSKELGKYEEDSRRVLGSVEESDYSSLYTSFINYEARHNGKNIACKQTPYYLSYLPEISSNMENVFFVYLVRDPRAVALSQKNRWRRNSLSGSSHPVFKEVLRSWANYHPYLTSKIWVNCERRADSYIHLGNFKKITYEELVENPIDTVEALCQWLDIEFEPTMVDIPFVGSSMKTDQSSKTGTDKSRISAWKEFGGLSATEISIIQKVAKVEMEELGYQPVQARTNVLRSISALCSLCVKAFLSISLNIYRSGNPLVLIKRRLNL